MEISKVKLGVRTTEEVLERCVLTLDQKEVLERSNTWLKELLVVVF